MLETLYALVLRAVCISAFDMPVTLKELVDGAKFCYELRGRVHSHHVMTMELIERMGRLCEAMQREVYSECSESVLAV
jgi:hypothetical protein